MPGFPLVQANRSGGISGLAPSPITGGAISVATLRVNSGQFTALFANPLTIVPAPGPKFAVIPIAYAAAINVTATWANSPTLMMRFAGAGAGFEWLNTTWAPTGAPYIRTRGGALTNNLLFESNVAARWPVGKALQITLSVGPVGGASTMEMSVAYYVAQLEP